MTTIYLMRHGFIENPDHWFYGPEFALSERGIAQITALAEDMKNAGVIPAKIITSPYRRAHETANVIAGVFGLEDVRLDVRLAEWNVGDYFDKPLSEFYAATKYDGTNRTFGSDIESLEDLSTRVIAAIKDARQRHPDGVSLLVSHRESMVSAILKLQGKDWNTIHDVSFPVASVWKLVFDGDRFVSAEKAFDRSEDGNPFRKS